MLRACYTLDTHLLLQDIVTRFKGWTALPHSISGLDHAGIATQNVVEKHILAQGLSKTLGRDEFIKRVWQWEGRIWEVKIIKCKL